MELDRRSLLAGIAALAGAPVLARAPSAYPPPDREMMVPVEGGRLYLRINGDPNGARPPVVFIHGGPGGNHAAFLDALSLAHERAVIL